MTSNSKKWFESLSDNDKKKLVFQVLGYGDNITVEEINQNISTKEIEHLYSFRSVLKN